MKIDSSKLTVLDKVILIGIAVYIVWLVVTIVGHKEIPMYIDPVNNAVQENIVFIVPCKLGPEVCKYV